ncbi:hypothetical protein WA026_001436 [Henosepilachna vigintioctopunctata]|uniref:Uncharacterized protein n=1 Tax=Henosepilachna vigintioctopunctata TaxID=420089 RepID=A0AAW1UTD3_9CUCU
MKFAYIHTPTMGDRKVSCRPPTATEFQDRIDYVCSSVRDYLFIMWYVARGPPSAPAVPGAALRATEVVRKIPVTVTLVVWTPS